MTLLLPRRREDVVGHLAVTRGLGGDGRVDPARSPCWIRFRSSTRCASTSRSTCAMRSASSPCCFVSLCASSSRTRRMISASDARAQPDHRRIAHRPRLARGRFERAQPAIEHRERRRHPTASTTSSGRHHVASCGLHDGRRAVSPTRCSVCRGAEAGQPVRTVMPSGPLCTSTRAIAEAAASTSTAAAARPAAGVYHARHARGADRALRSGILRPRTTRKPKSGCGGDQEIRSARTPRSAFSSPRQSAHSRRCARTPRGRASARSS